MPKSGEFSVRSTLADDSLGDDFDEDQEDQSDSPTIAWSMKHMLDHTGDTDKATLKEKLKRDSRYEDLEGMGLDRFLSKTYLGFLYIVPSDSSQDKQLLFPKIFRSINFEGKSLTKVESRKALYYQDLSMTNFFEGKLDADKDVLCDLSISQGLSTVNKLDWLRYLSILSQCFVGRRVLKGYAAEASREDYYSDYVAYIIGLSQKAQSDKFADLKLTDWYRDEVWKGRYKTLREQIGTLQDMIGKKFQSWIDADYWLFGLVYSVLFEGKRLDAERKDELKRAIEEAIREAKENPKHKSRPNQLSFLRDRLEKSIGVYKEYVS